MKNYCPRCGRPEDYKETVKSPPCPKCSTWTWRMWKGYYDMERRNALEKAGRLKPRTPKPPAPAAPAPKPKPLPGSVEELPGWVREAGKVIAYLVTVYTIAKLSGY